MNVCCTNIVTEWFVVSLTDIWWNICASMPGTFVYKYCIDVMG